MSGTWYVTNNPTTQNMTKQSLGNRSFINQVKYSPKWSSQAIVGTNDGNVWIGFNLGTGIQAQANWVDVTGGNAVLPNRPVLGHRPRRLDAHARPRGRLRGCRRLRCEHAVDAGARLPGDLHGELRHVHVARQDGQPAGHPGRLDHPEPQHPGTGLRRDGLGRVLHGRHHRRVADLVPVRQRHAAHDDLGSPDRPRRDDDLGVDARAWRLGGAAGRLRASTTASAAASASASASASTSAAPERRLRQCSHAVWSRRNDRRHRGGRNR